LRTVLQTARKELRLIALSRSGVRACHDQCRARASQPGHFLSVRTRPLRALILGRAEPTPPQARLVSKPR
jgi:hypothetical protein